MNYEVRLHWPGDSSFVGRYFSKRGHIKGEEIQREIDYLCQIEPRFVTLGNADEITQLIRRKDLLPHILGYVGPNISNGKLFELRIKTF